MLDHNITSFYIKYRFFGVICTFGNFIKINIEFWDQNFVKRLNSIFLEAEVGDDNFVFCFLHTYSSAVSIFILISASPPSQPAFFLHSDWLILKLWTTFIMAAEIPSPPSKNYHLKFSECQNIPENIVPIEILTQNSILNFLTNFQCQMIL